MEKAKKQIFQISDFDIPLYGGKLVLINSNSDEKIKEHIDTWEKDFIYAHAWHINYKGYDGYAIILNFQHEKYNITHGTLAHEALHTTNYIADLRGFVADFNNDEPLTYLIHWITDRIYEFITDNNLTVHLKKERT